MARTRTSWAKGQSGNPAGRRRGFTARTALRRALDEPPKEGDDETVLMRWAREIIDAAVTVDDRLSVLRWLEGPSPPRENEDRADDVGVRQIVIPGLTDAQPRIVIPGSPHETANADDDDDGE